MPTEPIKIKSKAVKIVLAYLSQLKERDQKIAELFQRIDSLNTDVFLIGGAIRNICEGYVPRDIDIMISADPKEIWQAIRGIKCKRNRFGGLKIEADNTEFDIWSTDTYWAFKEELIAKRKNNIARGTFFNFDSLVLDIKDKCLYADYYNQCIQTKRLDFVVHKRKYIDSNPRPVGNIVKAFILRETYGLTFSSGVRKYIADWARTESHVGSKLKRYESSHYKNRSFFTSQEYGMFVKGVLTEGH